MTDTRLVDILIDIGGDETQLRAAADEYYRAEKFGEWLVRRGAVSASQLDVALARQHAARGDYVAASACVQSAMGSVQQRMLCLIDAFRAAGQELQSVRQQ